jgi:CBS domain-containing protein
MTTQIISVTPEAPLIDVVSVFVLQAVRRILVVDSGGLLVGVLSWTDIVPYLPDWMVGRMVSSIVEAPSS